MELTEINKFLKRGDKGAIAEKLGYDRKTVSRALNGHYPNEHVIYAATLIAEKRKQEIKEAIS